MIVALMVYATAVLASDPICVRDDLKRDVCVPGKVSRVVSLAPSLTELVFALGMGEALVGRTTACNYPPDAAEVQVVGAYMRPDLERLIALKPDLVLTTKSGSTRAYADRLEQLGIPVFVSDTKTIEEVFDLSRKVGRLLGKDDKAADLVASLQRKRNRLKGLLKCDHKPTLLLAVGIKPLFVAGGGSFLGSLLKEVGCVNIAGDLGIDYPKFSIEEVIRRNPDVILVLNKECSSDESCLGPWKRYRSLDAVKRGRVAQIDADLVARPGPRCVQALEHLINAIHPGLVLGAKTADGSLPAASGNER